MPHLASSCRHPDIRKFDGVRCCLSCGVAILEAPATDTTASSIQSDSAGEDRKYRYKNLNFELGQEIRLVVILPGKSSDPIRCEIVHVNLEDDPEYAAISYTWATEDGDGRKSRLVHCTDDTILPVTVTCEASTSTSEETRPPAPCLDRLDIDQLGKHQGTQSPSRFYGSDLYES